MKRKLSERQVGILRKKIAHGDHGQERPDRHAPPEDPRVIGRLGDVEARTVGEPFYGLVHEPTKSHA